MSRARGQTLILDVAGRPTALLRSGVQLVVENGLDIGRAFNLQRGIVAIGSALENDVVLPDDTVSAFHAELELTDRGFLVRDLGSTNGTQVGDCYIKEVYARPGTRLTLGAVVLRLESGAEYEVPLGPAGIAGIAGQSTAIRECIALVQKFAGSDGPVLIQGETGVGKELFARALHKLSGRADQPFEVFDCAAASPSLVEAELFGHVRGAFTDARDSRPGVFERAHGGTLLLDELGELPLPLQPKLLRVLEQREVRRLGDAKAVPLDVRVLAATHRDLPTMVKQGHFREDLLYRLNVLRLEIPPLRRRREDVATLAYAILRDLGVAAPESALGEKALALLQGYDWPGNVRELRNVLQRAFVLGGGRIGEGEILLGQSPTETQQGVARNELSYHAAKEQTLEMFERQYVTSLLQRHGGSMTRAAEAAGIPRQTLRRIIVRYDIHVSKVD